MVMKPEPIFKAVEHIRDKTCVESNTIFLLKGYLLARQKREN